MYMVVCAYVHIRLVDCLGAFVRKGHGGGRRIFLAFVLDLWTRWRMHGVWGKAMQSCCLRGHPDVYLTLAGTPNEA